MFGLGKKHNSGDFLFDLEMEILDKGPAAAASLRREIQAKIQEVKALLRAGQEQKEYDELGVLLFGYTAVVKVLDRIEKKIKK